MSESFGWMHPSAYVPAARHALEHQVLRPLRRADINPTPFPTVSLELARTEP